MLQKALSHNLLHEYKRTLWLQMSSGVKKVILPPYTYVYSVDYDKPSQIMPLVN